MTISATTRTAGPFTGNGVTTVFPFTYKVFSRTDLMVARTVIATEVETLLVLDTDYTVTLNANQNSNPGGVITMLVAPPTGTTLAATSDISVTQNLDLTNAGGFYPTVINDAFDRVVIMIQQLNARIGLGALNVGASALLGAVLSFISNLAASGGSNLVGFIQAGIGAIRRSLQDKARERVSVKDFGAKGDGVTNDLPALQLAGAAMTSDMELIFPPGVYLLQWSGAKPERAIYALDPFQLNNIKISGKKATIKIVNHDTGAYGGLMFLRPRACKNIEVSGFHADMSFVGTNVNPLCYPESGFMYGHNTFENSAGGPVPYADQLADIEVHHCTFNIRSQYGAYTVTPFPYQGDTNNGGKYYSVFVRGEQADPVYASQNKGCKIHHLTFYDTHHGYGIWVWGFSNVDISYSNFQGYAVRTANHLNVTLGGSVPAIRCHKFFTRNWRICNNTIQGRVAPQRVGALDGSCAFISFQQEATSFDPESNIVIADNTLIVGSNTVGLADIGIQILCGGQFDILKNTFGCSSALIAATGIQLGDNSSFASNISQFINIAGNTFSQTFNKGQPIVYTSASSIAANQRAIKSLIVKDNILNGYFQSLLTRNVLGATFEGAIHQVIDGNKLNGNENTACPPSNAANVAIDIYVEQPGDSAILCNNYARSNYIGFRGTGPSIANAQAYNNKSIGSVLKPMVGVNNFTANSTPTMTAFVTSLPVVVGGSPNKLFGCIGFALDATGLVKNNMAGTYPGGTLLVAAPTGFTWVLYQWEVGDAA